VEASGLVDAGHILLQQKRDIPAAIKDFEDVLAVTDSPLLREPALGDLGFSYSELGEWKRAAYFSGQAAKLASDLRRPVAEKKWLIDLGREHLTQLEYADAEASFKKALLIARNLNDAGDTAICLHNLAQLALRTGDESNVEAYVREEQTLNPKGARFLELLLDQGQLAKARGNFAAAEPGLKQVQDESADPLLRWKAQSELAVVYAAQKKFDLADAMFGDAVRTAEAGRSQTEGVEYKISFLDQAPFYDEYVRFLVSRNRTLEALDVAELGRSPTLSEGLTSGKHKPLRGVMLRRIQQLLKVRQSVVLAYWLGWEESYLWVITPSQVKLFILPPELEIERQLEAYSREVSVPDGPETSHTGDKLYEILLGPAAALIPNGWNAIILPHRKLYNLNFETLVVPGGKPHYWIEDVASHNVNFLSALTNSRPTQTSATTKKLLLMGAPVFVDKQFPVLKQAPAEMKQIAGHFPAAEETVIPGKEATPAAYLASRPEQFRYLHFVTHGTTSTVLEDPLDSAIILSPDHNSVSDADPEGSYHLYGKAIMDKPLRAELVTVSACYGLGREYSGEGLVGLAWAFMRAGAHQVVAALWEVDDAATPQLMDTFYGELTQGKSAAEALRDAKLKLLHSTDFNRPYYWASLQLYSGS
jgi:CHAT domain-containing protein